MFIIPSDSDDIRKEYNILIGELEEYNPELLDKRRILGISKSDMLDEELMEEISKDLPELPHVFFSAITNQNIGPLKDMIWEALQD